MRMNKLKQNADKTEVTIYNNIMIAMEIVFSIRDYLLSFYKTSARVMANTNIALLLLLLLFS